MDDSTPVASREAVQRSLELLFIDQIRPRVIKASHFLPSSLSTLYTHESYQLDFINATTDMSNLQDKDKVGPRTRIPGGAASSQAVVESQSQESTTHEDEADLDLIVPDLDPGFDDSSGSEVLDDWETEPDILMF